MIVAGKPFPFLMDLSLGTKSGETGRWPPETDKVATGWMPHCVGVEAYPQNRQILGPVLFLARSGKPD
jgi:hypothetical protein